MSAGASLARRKTRRLLSHLRDPLNKTGYALTASSLLGAVVGFGYWAVAANLYSASVVGRTGAAIATMSLLSRVSILFLDGTLVRYLPLAGEASARLLAGVYALTVGVAAVATGAVVAGAERFVPSLAFLAATPAVAIAYVLSTAIWCVFIEQDSALTGLRRATWVPVENLAASVLRLILLVRLADSWPTYGIFASWIIPSVVLVPIVNVAIFRRLMPLHVAQTAARAVGIRVRDLARYASANYVGTLIGSAYASLPPVLVLEQRGSGESGHFYLAWMIADAIGLVAVNAGIAVTMEGSIEPSRLRSYRWRAVRNVARLVVPASVFLLVFADRLLGVFGPDYAESASALLRLLALAALPEIIVYVSIAVLRAQERVGAIVVAHAAVAVITLGGGWLMLERFGITGFGVAWLVAQCAVATTLLVAERRDGTARGRHGRMS